MTAPVVRPPLLPDHDFIARKTASPASSTGRGWADQLSQIGVAGLLTTLGPASAGSELLRRSLVLSFDRNAYIFVPGIVAAAGNTSFVGQSQPIPARQLDLSAGALLAPAKFATIVVLTRELIEGSNAELLVRQILNESVGAALDGALLDANGGTDTRPPGLLFGVGALTAASGGTIDAMRKDLGALAGAVAPVGGLNLAYVASPDVAVKIALAAGSEFRFTVLACGALASGGDLHRAQRPGSRDAQDRGEPKRRAAHGHRAGANFGLGPDGRGAGSKHVPNRHRRREANHVGGMGLEDRECTRMGFQRDVVIMGIGSKRETSPDLDAWCAERPSTPGMIREWLTRQPSQPVVRRKPPPGPRDEYAELRKGIAKLRSEVRSLRADLAEQRNGYATVDYVNGRLQEFFNKLVNPLNEISREEMESVDRVFDRVFQQIEDLRKRLDAIAPSRTIIRP